MGKTRSKGKVGSFSNLVHGRSVSFQPWFFGDKTKSYARKAIKKAHKANKRRR